VSSKLAFRPTRWFAIQGCCLSLIAGFGVLPCFGQTAGVAQISGVVRDASNAAIAGAQVKITQTDTKFVRETITDERGSYVAPALPVGPYQIDVSANGFKTFTQTGILLQVGASVDVNVSMQVGTASEHIDVQAEAAMVNTTDNAISQVIDERRIVDLPLDGRQPTQLILLSGAALSSPVGDIVSSKSLYSAVTISVAGGQGNGVNYLLDGGDNNDAFTNVNMPFPFPDALQEFSVQTSSLPARFGLHPAAVVNAVTKSGTNDWHASAFEFLRNGDVNARNTFAPVHDSLKRNQFGGTFGGPILKDKVFFFGGFQGTFNRSAPQTSIAYVPTAAMLNGDFSAFDSAACQANGKAIQTINPYTGLAFQNNQIPTSMFNSASLALVKDLPTTTNPCGKVLYGVVTTGDDDQGILRIDWVQSSKHTFLGRYLIDNYRNPAVLNGNLLASSTAGNLEQAQSFTLSDTYTFSGSLVNSAHATFNRRVDDRAGAPGIPTPNNLGVNVFSPISDFLVVTVGSYFNVGCQTCGPSHFNVNSFDFADDVDWVHGKHQIAFGLLVNRNQMNALNPNRSNGNYSFTGQYSNSGTTDAMAAFMLGVMNDFSQSAYLQNATRQTVVAAYVQDSIRLTPRLTINVGLRWDPAFVPYDAFNRGDSFSLGNFETGTRSSVYTNAPAGLLFSGDKGIPQGFQNGKPWQFSPRIGIAWDPTGSGRQTIRVGGAILRDTQELYYTSNETRSPPYGNAIDVPLPFTTGGTFSNPYIGYPGGSPYPLPSPLPSNFAFPSGGAYTVMPINMQPTYMAQWSVSYQRQITASWLLSATYLGNKTTHILGDEDINPAVYIPGSTASTNARRELSLLNPTLGAAYSNVVQADPGGNAHYDGLLVSAQHRFAKGFTLLTNYTWSHCLSDMDFTQELSIQDIYENPHQRRQDYGNCDFDVRHQFNTSLVIVSPIKGNGWAGRVLGGWQLAPLVSIRSGLPINILTGTDVSQTGVGLDRPNLVPGVDPYLHTGDARYYLNPAAFQKQAAGTFGDLGRNAITGPGALEVDLAFSRTFRVKERWLLTPRFEAFNVINHVNYNSPYTTTSDGTGEAPINSAQFGIFTSAGDPRILQFALKLQF
jgi:hypothetical protein